MDERPELGAIGCYYLKRGLLEQAERWRDEAADVAVYGNSPRAGYIEWWAGRVEMTAMGIS